MLCSVVAQEVKSPPVLSKISGVMSVFGKGRVWMCNGHFVTGPRDADDCDLVCGAESRRRRTVRGLAIYMPFFLLLFNDIDDHLPDRVYDRARCP